MMHQPETRDHVEEEIFIDRTRRNSSVGERNIGKRNSLGFLFYLSRDNRGDPQMSCDKKPTAKQSPWIQRNLGQLKKFQQIAALPESIKHWVCSEDSEENLVEILINNEEKFHLSLK